MGTKRFDGGPDVAIHHELVEVKAHSLPYSPPSPQTFDGIVTQLMKYVDFVAKQYAGGNYAGVSAMYIAHDYSVGIRTDWAAAKAQPTIVTTRSYVLNPRQVPPRCRGMASGSSATGGHKQIDAFASRRFDDCCL
jgi:hypothetical protein